MKLWGFVVLLTLGSLLPAKATSLPPYTASSGVCVTGSALSTCYVPVVISASASTPILSSYSAKRVSLTSTTGVALTLAQAGTTGFASGWSTTLVNDGTGGTSGTIVVTPTTSTICGGASASITTLGVALTITSDGVNYSCEWSGAPGGGTTAGPFLTGTPGGTVIVGRNDATLGNAQPLGQWGFQGPNSTGAATINYGGLFCSTLVSTAGSETGQCTIKVWSGGALIPLMTFSPTSVSANVSLNVGTGTGNTFVVATGTAARTATVAHIINTTGTTPTILVGAGAGTGGSATLSAIAEDTSFQINVVAGTVPTGAGATIATVTFGSAYTNSPICVFSPDGADAANSAAVSALVYPLASTGTFILKGAGVGITASQNYSWHVVCIGK